MTIYDTILWFESRETGRRFPVAQFSADTDMVTAGWVSLTSIEAPEIVVMKMVPSEYSAGIPIAYEQVERRVNASLGRGDLRASWLVEAVQQGPTGAGLSFQEFRKVYQPPRLLYRDIFADGSLAEEVAQVALSDFESSGGKVQCYEA